MTQELYDEIINCIRYGAPANADKLIVSFNATIKDAAEYKKIQDKCEPDKPKGDK